MFRRGNELAMSAINELNHRGYLPVDNINLVGHIANVPGTSIVSACILRVGVRFFLIVEIAVGTTIGTEMTRVIIIKISADLAARLLASGVGLCTVQTTVPTTTTGRGLSPEYTFVVDNTAFIIFLVPNRTDRIIVVTIPLCTVI